jgi:hypothetical protein
MAYKVFSNGDALTGGELNTYLMNQSVIQFASITARDAALPSPAEGQLVWLQDSNKYVYYTGSAWSDLITPASSGNAIINGAFDIWQRGTSIVASTGNMAYTADRWAGYRSLAGMTTTRQSAGLTGFNYCMRVARDSGNTTTADLNIVQAIETSMSLPFAGQTVAYSFYARAGANFSAASSNLKVYLYSGTGTDQNPIISYTGQATVASSTAITLTTSWQRFTITGTVGSTATELAAQFVFTPVGTAGAADFFEITGVQLEPGSTATAFKRNASNIQGELAACQRYTIALGGKNNYEFLAQGNSLSTTAHRPVAVLPVEMRSVPTSITVSSNSHFMIDNAANFTATVTSITLDPNVTSTKAAALTIATSSTLGSAGGVTRLLANNTFSALIVISAEL